MNSSKGYYEEKYLKYKYKYLQLKKLIQIGGSDGSRSKKPRIGDGVSGDDGGSSMVSPRGASMVSPRGVSMVSPRGASNFDSGIASNFDGGIASSMVSGDSGSNMVSGDSGNSSMVTDSGVSSIGSSIGGIGGISNSGSIVSPRGASNFDSGIASSMVSGDSGSSMVSGDSGNSSMVTDSGVSSSIGSSIGGIGGISNSGSIVSPRGAIEDTPRANVYDATPPREKVVKTLGISPRANRVNINWQEIISKLLRITEVDEEKLISTSDEKRNDNQNLFQKLNDKANNDRKTREGSSEIIVPVKPIVVLLGKNVTIEWLLKRGLYQDIKEYEWGKISSNFKSVLKNLQLPYMASNNVHINSDNEIAQLLGIIYPNMLNLIIMKEILHNYVLPSGKRLLDCYMTYKRFCIDGANQISDNNNFSSFFTGQLRTTNLFFINGKMNVDILISFLHNYLSLDTVIQQMVIISCNSIIWKLATGQPLTSNLSLYPIELPNGNILLIIGINTNKLQIGLIPLLVSDSPATKFSIALNNHLDRHLPSFKNKANWSRIVEPKFDADNKVSFSNTFNGLYYNGSGNYADSGNDDVFNISVIIGDNISNKKPIIGSGDKYWQEIKCTQYGTLTKLLTSNNFIFLDTLGGVSPLALGYALGNTHSTKYPQDILSNSIHYSSSSIITELGLKISRGEFTLFDVKSEFSPIFIDPAKIVSATVSDPMGCIAHYINGSLSYSSYITVIKCPIVTDPKSSISINYSTLTPNIKYKDLEKIKSTLIIADQKTNQSKGQKISCSGFKCNTTDKDNNIDPFTSCTRSDCGYPFADHITLDTLVKLDELIKSESLKMDTDDFAGSSASSFTKSGGGAPPK